MHTTMRFEANAGTVICFAITAITIGGCISVGIHEKSKKVIKLKEIEVDLARRNAEMQIAK